MVLRFLIAVSTMLMSAWAVPAQVPAPLAPEASEVSGETDLSPAEMPLDDGNPRLTKSDVDAWLDGFLPFAMARGDIAGAVVVVVRDGQILTEKGYGYSDVEAGTPVIPDETLFRPGSVSKLFTWTAVMQLVEDGQLDLDTDVNEYLDFELSAPDETPVTLRNIMTHTGGFQESVRHLMSSDAESMLPLDEMLKQSVPDRIFEPGTTPAYSNYATALAGYIVGRVSGMSFDDYVDRNIFAPLGMTRSSFRQPLPERLKPLMSKGYLSADADAKPFEFVAPAPAGSLSATGHDMAAFMIAHLNDGGPLLSPETARLMHNSTFTALPPLDGMALGFFDDSVGGIRGIGHGGDTQYFHSDLMLFPEQDVGIYVSFNSSGKNGITGPLRAALVSDFAERYFGSDPLGNQRVDPGTAKAHARQMVGTYASSRGFQTNFLAVQNLFGQAKVGLTPEGGIYVESATNAAGNPRTWVEIAPYVWRDERSDEYLVAQVVDGEVVRWSTNAVTVYDRVPWYLNSSWIMPALIAALAILVITVIAWPAGVIARRRFRAARPFEGEQLRTFRATRIFSLLVLLVSAGWAYFMSTAFSNLGLLGGALDPLLYTLQIGSILAYVGLFGLAIWNLILVWTHGNNGWLSKLWSVLLVFAAFMFVWVAFNFHLIGFGTKY